MLARHAIFTDKTEKITLESAVSFIRNSISVSRHGAKKYVHSVLSRRNGVNERLSVGSAGAIAEARDEIADTAK